MGQDLRQTFLTLFCVLFGITLVVGRDYVRFTQEEHLARLEIVRLQTAADLNRITPEQAAQSYKIDRDAKKRAIPTKLPLKEVQ